MFVYKKNNIHTVYIMELPTESKKKDYALCMYGQPRAVKSCIGKLYENLVDVLDADLYIVLQKTYTDIDNDIDLFDKKVVNKIVYDPPKDIESMYPNYEKLLISNECDNYICKASLQVYYNWCKINEMFGDILEKNYRYIIVTRSDFYHLFPFPNILHFDKTDETFWTYDTNSYGGINATLTCVPSKYIKNYLTVFKSFLDDSNNIEPMNNIPFCKVVGLECVRLNTERYTQLIFDTNKWNNGKLRTNSFLSASSLQEITTWGSISYDSVHNLYYKYHEQYMNALSGVKKYNESKKWTYQYNESDNTKKILLL